MPEHQKMPPDTMTVIIRNDAPLVHAGDSPSYRSVRIRLTHEQRTALMLGGCWNAGNVLWEQVSMIILEQPKDQDEPEARHD